MKKKLFILSLFLLLLIPFSAKAYTYDGYRVEASAMKSKGWVTTWPQTNLEFRVGPAAASKHVVRSYFYYHQVYDGSTKYAVICTNIGKLAGNPATVDVPLDYVGGLESIKNSSGDTISAAQVELLKNLLVNGYHYDTTNTKHINQIDNSKDDTLSMIAMQLLIWEIVEGGRTSFDSVAPQYNPSNSAYNVYVYPNG